MKVITNDNNKFVILDDTYVFTITMLPPGLICLISYKDIKNLNHKVANYCIFILEMYARRGLS